MKLLARFLRLPLRQRAAVMEAALHIVLLEAGRVTAAGARREPVPRFTRQEAGTPWSRRARVGWLLFAMVMAAAQAAQAQAGSDFPTQARARLGPLHLKPSFSLDRFGLETNVFSEPVPKPDFVVSATPRVDAWLPFQRWARLSTSFIAGSDWYAKHAGERSFNPDFRYRFDASWRRVAVAAGGGRLRTRRRPDYEIDLRSNRFSRDLYGAVAVQILPKLSVDFEVRQRTVGFDADALFEGTYLSETLNRGVQTGVASLRWRRTALTTFVLASEVRAARFLRAPDRNSDNVIVTAGVEFHPRALISGSGRIGMRRFKARGAAVSDISSVVAQADLSYRISGRTALTFSAERDINYSFERAAPYFVINRYGLTVTRRLGRQFDLSGQARRDIYDYQTDRRGRDVRWNMIGELGYILNPTTRLGLQAGFVKRASAIRARQRYRSMVLGVVLDYDI